jgi:hypothetical protein
MKMKQGKYCLPFGPCFVGKQGFYLIKCKELCKTIEVYRIFEKIKLFHAKKSEIFSDNIIDSAVILDWQLCATE